MDAKLPTLAAALLLVVATLVPTAQAIGPTSDVRPGTPAATDASDGFPFANADGTPIGQAMDFLGTQQDPDGSVGSFAVSAWVAVAVHDAGEDPATWTACDTCPSLEDYLVEEGADRVDRGRTLVPGENSTDWGRHLLAVAHTGADVRDADGVDYVDGLLSTFDGTQFGHPDLMWDDYTAVLALHATGLDATNPTVEAAVDAARDHILANQFPDGGWSWRSLDSTNAFFVAFGPTSDADSTAAAIQALIAADVDADSLPVERGLDFVKTHQQTDGGCGSAVVFDSAFNAPLESNTGSTSWVVDAITASKGDPTADDWTTPTGNDLVDFLVGMQRSDGGFRWSDSHPDGFTEDSDIWMTAYAVTALTGSSYAG